MRCTKKVRSLYEMATKEPHTSADIRRIAAFVRDLADAYENSAKLMDEKSVETVDFAAKTLWDETLNRVQSSTGNLLAAVLRAAADQSKIRSVDARRQARVLKKRRPPAKKLEKPESDK